MAFTLDMKQAANRHFDAADALDGANKRSVAAYLYGLAAECAVKGLLKHFRVPEKDERSQDPYYAHFPTLRGLLSDAMQGRGAAVLERFTKDAFLSEWDIVIRYAQTTDIVGNQKRYDKWKDDAKKAIDAMGDCV